MSRRQLAMVMDLNKCIGCQTCTSACKTQWTNRNGRDYMYWNNVETHPGSGQYFPALIKRRNLRMEVTALFFVFPQRWPRIKWRSSR